MLSFIASYLCFSCLSFVCRDFKKRILKATEGQKVYKNGNVPLVLVGNKADLAAERQVSTTEGQELAKQIGAQYIVCVSAFLSLIVVHFFIFSFVHKIIGNICTYWRWSDDSFRICYQTNISQ
jgi:hypothetical protein